MNDAEPIAHDAAARVLALMLAARGWINDCELQALDEIDAFRRLGIDRDRFVNLAQAYAHDMGSHLGETSWLRDGDRAYVDSLLRQVTDPDERCLVCRLATAAMAAGGCDWNEEHMVYAHVQAEWGMHTSKPAVEPPR